MNGFSTSMNSSNSTGIDSSSQRPSPAANNPLIGTVRTKKRNRAVLSCSTCHERRVKCDRKQPCETCILTGKANDCTFINRVPQNKATRTSKDKDASAAIDRRASSSYDDSPPHKPVSSKNLFEQSSGSSVSKAAEMDAQYPISAFFAFVERFQQHTQTIDRDRIIELAYPSEVVAIINAARNDLPTPDRTRLLILFFFDHLDWTFEAGDFDEMESWLIPFLNKMSHRDLCLSGIENGDVTRLCLIITILTAVIQSANEGLIQTHFLDSNISRISEMKVTRQSLKDTYDAHIRNLLDSATHQDGSSLDLIRSSIMYYTILKNEGRHYESANKPFLQSISHLVKQEELYLDPSAAIYSIETRNSRRRLFWTFYCFDRMIAAHSGSPLSIAEEQITTKETSAESWSPTLGRRVNMFGIYRSRLCRIGGKMTVFLLNDGVQAQTVDSIDKQLTDWQAFLPPELQPSLPDLPPDLYQLRTLDLQRRVMLIMYYSVRSGLHRLCFFPTETISMDQVRKSRRICVESAMSIIKVQEGLRLRLISEHHHRFFFLPYFMLESAITLVLTTLIEVGDVALGSAIPDNINEYMKWSHRALHLLSSLPSDFPPAVQGARLLSRVLTKASQILELHAQRKLTVMDSNSAIRDVLLDDQGRKISIPLHEPNHPLPPLTNGGSASTYQTAPSESSNSQNERTPASLTSSSSFGDLSSSLPPPNTATYLQPPKALPDYSKISPTRNKSINSTIGINMDLFQKKHSFTPTLQFQSQEEEPTYADLGLDFFDTMANSMTNPFCNDADALLMSQQQMQQQQLLQQTPSNSSFGMDDQMDIWLATLQTG